jgi:hypothetical protein
MTPKEKANDLVDAYRIILMNEDTDCGEEILCTVIAKKSALIAVEQIKFFHDSLFYVKECSLFDDYLNQVKHEIEKL